MLVVFVDWFIFHTFVFTLLEDIDLSFKNIISFVLKLKHGNFSIEKRNNVFKSFIITIIAFPLYNFFTFLLCCLYYFISFRYSLFLLYIEYHLVDNIFKNVLSSNTGNVQYILVGRFMPDIILSREIIEWMYFFRLDKFEFVFL